MIMLFAVLGLIAGWLLEYSGDALIHWSGIKTAEPRLRAPAWLCLLRRQPDTERASLVFELFMAILFALLYALHGISGETLWLIAACSTQVASRLSASARMRSARAPPSHSSDTRSKP